MKRQGTCALVAAALLLVAGVSQAQDEPTFTLGFDCPGSISGKAGSSFKQVVAMTLTTADNPADAGAQGYSVSMSSTGVAITGISTAGTVSADVNADPPGLRSNGFEQAEVTTRSGKGTECEGRDGAILAIVLSFSSPITLPPEGTETIGNLTVEGTIPAGGGTASVEYADGCQGIGQPVFRTITFQSGSASNVLVENCAIALEEEVDLSCPNDRDATQLILGGPGATQPDPEGPNLVSGAGSATIDVSIKSILDGSGIQGHSLSIGVEDTLTLEGATTDGTAAADVADGGLRSEGFENTEIVDPAELRADTGEPQGQGVVSAVVLSFQMPITFDPVGEETVLKITVSGETGATGTVSPNDGLKGSGQRVPNVATVDSQSRRFECSVGAIVTIEEGVKPAANFIRCDPNDDGLNDIADAVWIVNELFRGGPATACRPSADCDSNAMVDLGDAVFAVEYQFLGGMAPSAPFPDCGGSDLVSGQMCPVGSTSCP